MTLELAVLVACGALGGALTWLRRSRPSEPALVQSPDLPWYRRLTVGGVVTGAGEDLVIERHWTLSERGQVFLELFEGDRHALLVRGSELAWLERKPAPNAPPSALTLELDRMTYQRRRCLPLSVDVTGARSVAGARGIYSEYRANDESWLMIIDLGSTRAVWSGATIEARALELWSPGAVQR